MTPVFIIGCGDVGTRLGRRWLALGIPVEALARSAESAARLSAHGIRPIPGDLDRPESLQGLPLAGRLIYHFAPPPSHGDTDPRTVALIEALGPQRPARVIYLSTSGVYGDHGGALVDEETPPAPATDRARRRLDAEQRLRHWGRQAGVPVVVLRAGGIYGPGRLPRERLEQSQPVILEAECPPTNRIHSEDLALVCIAAAERGGADRLYNVADGADGTMTRYFYAVADALGLPRPPAISLAEARRIMSPAMLSYLTESRRLDTRRLREELEVVLQYPNLSSGLTQILAEDNKTSPGPP